MSLPKDRVKHFMKLGRDLETSLGSVLTMECLTMKIMQIFYDELGPQDRYLIDAASGGTFMSIFEDEAMELIKMVAENNHHNTEKLFGSGCRTPKEGLIDAKSVETGMLLEKINKMAEVQNRLLDRVLHPQQI